MAKFQVGDRVEIIKPTHPENFGKQGVVLGVAPEFVSRLFGEQAYETDISGPGLFSAESQLRKLPGDDAEDPGLTRLKKLLLQDAPKVPQPVKA